MSSFVNAIRCSCRSSRYDRRRLTKSEFPRGFGGFGKCASALSAARARANVLRDKPEQDCRVESAIVLSIAVCEDLGLVSAE